MKPHIRPRTGLEMQDAAISLRVAYAPRGCRATLLHLSLRARPAVPRLAASPAAKRGQATIGQVWAKQCVSRRVSASGSNLEHTNDRGLADEVDSRHTRYRTGALVRRSRAQRSEITMRVILHEQGWSVRARLKGNAVSSPAIEPMNAIEPRRGDTRTGARRNRGCIGVLLVSPSTRYRRTACSGEELRNHNPRIETFPRSRRFYRRSVGWAG